MATILLLRHGLTAVTGATLAGRAPGLGLDERGSAQALAVGDRLSGVPLVRVVTSPLERCVQTARAVVAAQKQAGRTPRYSLDRRLIECDYGDWTGQPIAKLAKDPLWPIVQAQPSAVTFPGGESMAAIAARASQAARAIDADVTAEHGPDAVWVACSHGDVIKAIVADALGQHLDLFQRIVVDPASITAIRYTPARPYVLALNASGEDLSRFAPPAHRTRSRSRRRPVARDATVGGGSGGGSV